MTPIGKNGTRVIFIEIVSSVDFGRTMQVLSDQKKSVRILGKLTCHFMEENKTKISRIYLNTSLYLKLC